MSRLKVYGGHLCIRGKQVRAIVAATSQAKAAAAAGTTLTEIRAYWCVTGNPNELATALARPGVVFVAEDRWERSFRPLATASAS